MSKSPDRKNPSLDGATPIDSIPNAERSVNGISVTGQTRLKPNSLWLIVALLLVIVASRAYRLDVDVLDVQTDEAWSVFQTFGALTDVVRWTPYDWTPLYYVELALWRGLVGAHPVALRWLSVLLFAVGCGAMYRVGRRLIGEGVIPMLAFAAFGYMVFLSTEMRGYAFMLAVYPLALWWTLRYFYQPTLRRAVPLGIALAALFYTSLTAVPASAMLVLFTLIVYGARAWRWIVPAAIAAVIAAPEIINKAGIVAGRARATATIQLPPLGDALTALYRAHTGDPFWLWVGLVIFALVLISPLNPLVGRNRSRPAQPRVIIVLLAWLLMPFALYVTNGLIGFFNHRYAWWVMVGAALLVGAGAARLAAARGSSNHIAYRAAYWGTAALLVVFAFLPMPLDEYQLGEPPLAESFAWLADHAQPGDVVLLDPNCACASTERLAYLSRAYFPDGLRYVGEPGNYRRVWYVTGAAGATPEILASVERGRVAGEFVGPPEALFRVYEAPPDPAGEVYANGMRFHGAEIVGMNGLHTFHEGETFTLRLWWTVDRPPEQDYSVGVFVIDAAGAVVIQQDSAPRTNPPETSRWQPGTIYVEDRTFTLPFPLPRDTYRVMLALYWWQDQTRITAPGISADGLRYLTDLYVASW